MANFLDVNIIAPLFLSRLEFKTLSSQIDDRKIFNHILNPTTIFQTFRKLISASTTNFGPFLIKPINFSSSINSPLASKKP